MESLARPDDNELFQRIRTGLCSAVIGDILDQAGRTRQFLPAAIQPLRADMIVCGRAMPVLQADDVGGEGPGRYNESLNRPFGLMLRALDDLKPDEVYVCAGATPNYALWGELMNTCALNRGAAGAVLHGFSRDTRGILEMDLPCFSLGRYAKDQRARGKIIDFRCRIEIDGVQIHPGDIVFGDLDGVVIVPREIEADVIASAWEKAHGEKLVFAAIKKGMGAQDAWDTFGIL
jgi:regulator of RNase E activity RraA